MSVVGHGNVEVSVVIVISDTYALRPSLFMKSSLFRDFPEMSIPLVVIKLERRGGSVSLGVEPRPIRDQDVVSSVAIIIEDCGAVTCGLKDVIFACLSAVSIRYA